jgi:magnesium chelatase subunit H
LRGDGDHIPGYRVVIVTLDSHAAGPAARVTERLAGEFPGLNVSVHAAAEWSENPAALEEARVAVRHGDIIVANLLFIEEHITAILPDLQARRDACDAMIGVISAREVVQLTKMGELDMMKPATGPMRLLKKLRGSKEPSANSGEKQMKLLRRLPKILRFIPGKAQDLRAWFLTMQYWLGGSDDNVEQMVRFLVGTYAHDKAFKGARAAAPIDYADVGLYHPDLPGHRIVTDVADLPNPENPVATVGLLMMRSYVLASDTGHYDGVIRKMQDAGLAVIPAFAGGLDGRPAIDAFFSGGRIDALVSLTGFSLIGGPAYNDSNAAVETLKGLDVPYLAAHPIEFQTLGQWASSDGGLGTGRDDDARGPARDRRGDQPDSVRWTAWAGGLSGLFLQLPAVLGHQGDGALPGADRQPCRKDAAPGPVAAEGQCRQEGGNRPVRLPAECRGRRHGGVSQRLREPLQHADADEGRGLRGRGSGIGR